MTTSMTIKPWYREPWPWLLMLGPFVVVCAAIYTAWLAMSTADGLVTDDYYKQGLSVNKTLASSEQATKLGLSVALRITEEGFIFKLSATDAAFVAPPTLAVTLSHPTRAGMDQSQVFQRIGDSYIGKMRLPKSGHWIVIVADEAHNWRLMGNVVLPASGEILIGRQ